MDAIVDYSSSPYLSDADTSESSNPTISSREMPLTKRSKVSLRKSNYLSPSAILFIPILIVTKWQIFPATACDKF